MILIVVKQRVKAEYAEGWTDLVGAFTQATRDEPGNLFFEWSRSTEDPNLYILLEAFRDSQAGEAHVRSAHFAAAMEQLPQWLSEPPEIINVEVPGEGFGRMSEFNAQP